VDAVAGVADVAGHRVGGGDGVGAGLDLDGLVAAGGAGELLIDHPVPSSIHLLTAKAAKTIVRWASIESRWRW
jgi:hypothetical protein